MPGIRRPSGIELTIPTEFQAIDIPAAPPRGRRGRMVPTAVGAGRSIPPDAVAAAFRQQEMALLDQFQVEPTPAAAAPARRRVATNPALGLEVPLAPHEDAVVLLEQDGLYSWHFAAEVPAAATRRRGPGAAAERRVRFAIALGPEPTAGTGAVHARGIIGDFLRDKVRAFIFKFAARVVVGQAMKFLERNVQRGLVHLASPDPTTWNLLADPARLKLPKTRPARVLLLVHGTFSSTLGAFAALPATEWGQAFLRAAFGTYDVVLGFDHATLSEDPLENATELLAALRLVPWAGPPRVDIVTHSRGGLVTRSLVELLLPLTDFQVRVERVVFVGATNGGTLLAAPANWQALVDLFTNLSVAACNVLGMLPQAKGATAVLEELVRGLGAFVKYLATTAVTDRLVPGLAAMEPTGDFVRRLNEEQPGQPTIGQSYYCAVTSEFRPQVLGGTHEPRELPARVLEWLGGGFMQGLMREANDLVVNTAAMTRIDPAAGNFLKDTLAFGPNPQVYHTNYFVQPRVVNALTRWLRLEVPVAARAAAVTRGSGRRPPTPLAVPRRPAPLPSPPGRFVEPDVPVAVDLDVHVAPAGMAVGEALRAVREARPSYVVVRQFKQGQPQDFAYATEHFLKLSQAHARSPQKTLGQALRLDSLAPSAVFPARAMPAEAPELGNKPGGVLQPEKLAVFQRQGSPVGVVSPRAGLLDGPGLARLDRQVRRPQNDVDFVQRRRAMPTFAPRGTVESFAADALLPNLAAARNDVVAASSGGGERPVRPRAAKPKAAPMGNCHFGAQMDQVVDKGRATTVEVTISQEAIQRARNVTTDEQGVEIPLDAPLQVQVLPKRNFETVGDGIPEQVVNPPAAGQPRQLVFSVRATDLGPGEVWVVVRQAQVPLLTLVLKPTVVQPGAAARGGTTAAAAAAPLVPTAATELHQLFITEQLNGTQTSYLFQLEMPRLGVSKWVRSQPFTGDRQAYVASLYQDIEQRWLSNKDDTTAFTAELRAVGATLFDELIPAELQQVLWRYRDQIGSILVIAEEPFIPWELVHLHAPGKALGAKSYFFGQLGLVRWLHQAGWPRQQLYLRPGKCRYVVPDYPDPRYVLPEAKTEGDFLKQHLQATPVAATTRAVLALLKKPGAFDLLHFACHGEANSDNIANAQLLLQGRMDQGQYVPEPFSATTAEQYVNFGAGAPVVVLNACQAGRLGYRLTGVGGFAKAFLSTGAGRGAGAFIGTLWSVGDQPARSFTETFYARLLAGDTLAEATTAAREHARTAGDATWLAYAVYGHPLARASR